MSDATSATADAQASPAARGGRPLRAAPQTSREGISLERLAEALETVHRLCPELPVLAIRWMHLKHPLHEVQEALIRGQSRVERTAPDRGDRGRWTMLTRWIRPPLLRRAGQCVVYALYMSCRLVPLHLLLRRQVAALKRQRFELIAKTCCFWPNRPAADWDFYFGDLQQRVVHRGVRMLLLCGNVVGGSWRAFAKAHLAASPMARMPELCLVPPLAPLRLMAKQLATSLRLRRIAAQAHDPLVKRLSALASQDCLAPDTARAGLYFWMGRSAVQTWRPRAFLTLYEGHAWEFCARWGATSEDGSCQTVGYQHTAVFPESLSMTAPSPIPGINARVLPDVVLCLGEAPLGLLRAGHERHQIRLAPFGSFRYQAPVIERPADPHRRTMLVTPEGLVSEVKALFTFAYACAQRMPAYTFVLRCHPELPLSKALQLVSVDLTNQPNLILSEHRRIEDDFARASGLLYRGSSAVMYAVLHGVLPIYLHVPTLFDRDPLYWLDGWRRRCATPEDVADIMERHERTPLPRVEAEWEAAARAVQTCTGPVSDANIDAFLETLGLNDPGPAPRSAGPRVAPLPMSRVAEPCG